MRVESNIDFIQNKTKINNINNEKYYHFNSGSDLISFSANINKPVQNSFEKFVEMLSMPINIIKKQIEKYKLKSELKKKAEEAARQAEIAVIRAERTAKDAKRLESAKAAAKEVLADWQVRNKGKFVNRVCVDDTGDIIFVKEVGSNSQHYTPAPKRGEYTLANIGGNGLYASKPSLGQTTFYIKDKNGTYVSHLHDIYYYNQVPEFADHRWRVRHTETMSLIDGKCHPCTLLSVGFYDRYAVAMSRQPGVNFLIEGHIPLDDMAQIKKNIVEKGLWKNFIEHQDEDAHIAIYNEIINYLNKY